MEKEKYENLKDIKRRLHNGEKTTFAERNIVNIESKKALKKALAGTTIRLKTAHKK